MAQSSFQPFQNRRSLATPRWPTDAPKHALVGITFPVCGPAKTAPVSSTDAGYDRLPARLSTEDLRHHSDPRDRWPTQPLRAVVDVASDLAAKDQPAVVAMQDARVFF